jgi:ribosome recycling factor
MLDKLYADYRARMQKSTEALESEFARIRTARANPAILDGIKVNYYNQPTPLKQVATVSVPEPRQLVVQPWDRTLLPEIEKALLKADLGLTPRAEANLVRIPIPTLTEERRRDLVRLCAKITEDSRIAIRNLRREANDAVKKLEKDKKITEDESKTGAKKVQEMTDEFIRRLDDLFKRKETEVLEK